MSAYGKYQNAYKRASVNTMDQNKLIVMLYDGAIKNITFGVEQMRLGNVEKTHTHLVKSKNIVAELMASLNMDKGGEVAKNLRSLYSYMFGQLIESNMSKNPDPALACPQTVGRIAGSLGCHWQEERWSAYCHNATAEYGNTARNGATRCGSTRRKSTATASQSSASG